MDELKLGVVEMRFAEIIWANAPVGSGMLVKLAQQELEWKKSTTYTVLKKLCGKGLFMNENGTVKTLISKEEYLSKQSEEYVNDEFGGSLPAFIAAFTKNKPLSEKEIEEIKALINKM